jgi:hypothetical protein
MVTIRYKTFDDFKANHGTSGKKYHILSGNQNFVSSVYVHNGAENTLHKYTAFGPEIPVTDPWLGESTEFSASVEVAEIV